MKINNLLAGSLLLALWWQSAAIAYSNTSYQKIESQQLSSQNSRQKNKNNLANNLSPTLQQAQALNEQGRQQLSQGRAEEALATWQKAEAAYREAGDPEGIVGSQINQAGALQSLGLYRRALNRLTQVGEMLADEPDSRLKAASLRSLGKALQRVGEESYALQVLQQSLELARRLNSAADIAESSIDLGNAARANSDPEAALEFYLQAASTAPSPITKVQAKLNQLSLFIEYEKWSNALEILEPIESELNRLSPSRAKTYARINFAESLMDLASGQPNSQSIIISPAELLAVAVREARSLQDRRAESSALGKLGKLYEKNGQESEALQLTERALLLAQAINAPDIAYRWQWQLGRILVRQYNFDDAIAAYSEAIGSLESLRADLVAINQDVRFSFRESVEPVYRQYVALLLQPSLNSDQGGKSGQASQENLYRARQAIESLQLAELDNFFRDACLDVQPVRVDRIDPYSAVIYPIILEKRLEVIISLPGQPLRHYSTPISQSEVENKLFELRQSLTPIFSNQQRLQISQEVYNWLIEPVETELANSDIETLVFVPDGSFRNVPLSVLYDGDRYLIEQYGIAITPGLQLLNPQPLAELQLQALTGGLSEARDGFSALPAVEFELNQIESEVPARVILNQDFTKAGLKSSLEAAPFPVVHLATHGQFSSNADETFILAWDGRIDVKELNELLRGASEREGSPIELLVFSACQTAIGDKRAALGLAGVAVRSGARSTLATLWSVQDRATAILMAQFYRELGEPGLSKAEALRRAQLSLLQERRYKHPFYWAPFVLVGNWL